MLLFPLALFPFPSEDLSPVWTRVETAIRQGYYARQTRHDEMERRLAAGGPLAKAAKDRAAFDAALDGMIAGFHDSHFDFLTDEEPGYYAMAGIVEGEKAPEMPHVGAWFSRSSDGYTVQMVLEGGAAEAAGLRVGDVVRRVEAEPFTPVAALRSHVGETVTLAYRRGAAQGEARVAVAKDRVLRMFLDATRRSVRVVERDGKRYGVIHLWTHANDDFRRALADALTGPLKDTDALVLDERAGYGGRPDGFEELFRGKGAVYTKPMAVVIDRGSRSAKEVFSYDLRKAGRAILVGENTAGHVLGTYPRRVAPWAYLEIPLTEYKVNGVRLEGVGVSPDVPVPAGEDPIERAITVLGAKSLSR